MNQLKWALCFLLTTHYANLIHGSETLIEELRQLKNERSPTLHSRSTTPSRSKRAIREHYSDLHCLQKFETSPQTIIRTEESRNNGAVFLNVTTLDNYNLCLSSCCDTRLCNVAIFDEQVRRRA